MDILYVAWPVLAAAASIGAALVAASMVYKHRLSRVRDAGTPTVGTLVGFRKPDDDSLLGRVRLACGSGTYTDYKGNVWGSRPVFRFEDDGAVVEKPTEFPVEALDRMDVWRDFPIRYVRSARGTYRVSMDGFQYAERSGASRRSFACILREAGFGILAVSSIAGFVLAISELM